MVPPKFELTQLANVGGYLGGVAVDANHNVYVCNATKVAYSESIRREV